MSAKPKHEHAGRVFLPGRIDARGPMPAVRVRDDGSLELGVARVAAEGEPMRPGELLAAPGPDGYRIIELKGPRQVATPAYREGWARTFDRSLN
jgi:hypothetical protein